MAFNTKNQIIIISFQYKILLYSVDGRCLAKYSAYENALGVKSIAWSPTSQFLAIGSYDEKVMDTIFNGLGVISIDWFPTS